MQAPFPFFVRHGAMNGSGTPQRVGGVPPGKPPPGATAALAGLGAGAACAVSIRMSNFAVTYLLVRASVSFSESPASAPGRQELLPV